NKITRLATYKAAVNQNTQLTSNRFSTIYPANVAKRKKRSSSKQKIKREERKPE
ncbi:11774_t:CDS:1, partial [Funneliformis geosporum]